MEQNQILSMFILNLILFPFSLGIKDVKNLTAIMSLRKVDSLHLSTTHGPCEIQLMVGDITELSLDEKVDLLIVSAFPSK